MYQELRERAVLSLKTRRPQPEETKEAHPYEPGKKQLGPDEKRKFGFHQPDESAKHPNEGKPHPNPEHRGRTEYHYGWELVHSAHGQERQQEGRGSSGALPGRFGDKHSNNKDFMHRMIRGIHHNRMNKEGEVMFTSHEHNHSVIANVHPEKKQIRIVTVLPKGNHKITKPVDKRIVTEGKELDVIDLDQVEFDYNVNDLMTETFGFGLDYAYSKESPEILP